MEIDVTLVSVELQNYINNSHFCCTLKPAGTLKDARYCCQYKKNATSLIIFKHLCLIDVYQRPWSAGLCFNIYMNNNNLLIVLLLQPLKKNFKWTWSWWKIIGLKRPKMIRASILWKDMNNVVGRSAAIRIYIQYQ